MPWKRCRGLGVWGCVERVGATAFMELRVGVSGQVIFAEI